MVYVYNKEKSEHQLKFNVNGKIKLKDLHSATGFSNIALHPFKFE
jgi:hypothetical protein